MSVENVVLIVVLIAALMAVQALTRPGSSVDLGSPLRDRLRAGEARRWSTGSRPEVVKRSYWTAREYSQDIGRMTDLGYREAERELLHLEPPPLPGIPAHSRFAYVRRRMPYAYVVWELKPGFGTVARS